MTRTTRLLDAWGKGRAEVFGDKQRMLVARRPVRGRQTVDCKYRSAYGFVHLQRTPGACATSARSLPRPIPLVLPLASRTEKGRYPRHTISAKKVASCGTITDNPPPSSPRPAYRKQAR